VVAAPIKVLIADDHPVVRQGLRSLLDVQDDIEVAGEAADGAETVEQAQRLAPDVILLDLKLPGLDGVAVLRELHSRGVSARALVLTSVMGSEPVAPAMQAGAAGYLYKDVDPVALVRAIRSVHDGNLVLAPDAAGALSHAGTSQPGGGHQGQRGQQGNGDREYARGVAALTGREQQVLGLLARGRSNREIARSLGVSEKTVKTHVSSVLTKLGVQDRTQAAVYAVRHGLDGHAV
jgi:DNA-binding NarL/FixJ family response regulator